jgi:glycosyltransferase involved in cell wall biosynthesis
LLIAGEGPLKGELEKKALENGVAESVIFLGKVPQASLFEYVKAANVFVLNTDYEGFSHQLLETMALGTPIITTPVGGNIEVIDDGRTAIFVGYNDKMKITESILHIVRDPASSETMVKNAKAKVREFSDSRMLDGLVAFLNTIK